MRRMTARTLGATTALAGIMLALGACGETADTADAAVDEAAPAEEAVVETAAIACDRACLIAATDAYVAALVAHDPAAANLAPDVAFVENVTRLQPGEGLWATAVAGPAGFVVHVPDEVNQSAGYIGVMQRQYPLPLADNASDAVREDAADGVQDIQVAIRLQFNEAGQIAEAEHILAGVSGPNLANNLQTPRPGLVAEIPADRRLPHDELIRLGATYYDALDDNDSDLTVFAPDCERHENGIITATGNPTPGPSPVPANPNAPANPPLARDCYGQIESGAFQYIDRIENRRVFAADPVTGLAMGLSHFRHPMNRPSYTVTAADGTVHERAMSNAPFDMPAAHIFKIGPEGQFHEIEAVGALGVPYNAPTGWE